MQTTQSRRVAHRHVGRRSAAACHRDRAITVAHVGMTFATRFIASPMKFTGMVLPAPAGVSLHNTSRPEDGRTGEAGCPARNRYPDNRTKRRLRIVWRGCGLDTRECLSRQKLADAPPLGSSMDCIPGSNLWNPLVAVRGDASARRYPRIRSVQFRLAASRQFVLTTRTRTRAPRYQFVVANRRSHGPCIPDGFS
mgnify:CR=1 FL=1